MKAYSPYILARQASEVIPTLIVQMSGDTIVPNAETDFFLEGTGKKSWQLSLQ